MFKKLLSWFGVGDANKETVKEILTPPTVAESIKAAVNDQITDAVTAKPKKRRRKHRRPITEGKMNGGNGAVKQRQR